MGYYAGKAGGEAAYDQTRELEQLVLVKLEARVRWRLAWLLLGSICSGSLPVQVSGRVDL
jgi:hypothetical protein